MSRLTEKRKYPNGYEYQIEDLYENTTDDCVDKLGKLEDLEEQLGCSLDVYVKATINGIIVDGELFKVKVRKDKDGYYFALSNGSCFPFYLKDYKKTWKLEEDRS